MDENKVAMKDEIPYFLQVQDMDLARQKQTIQDLEDLAAYRRLKLQAYKDWSASGGKEFTYYNEKGELVKIDVHAKRQEAAATQDDMAGTEISPAYTVRKAYRDYLTGQVTDLGRTPSTIHWTPVPPPIDLTWFDRVCLRFQSWIRRLRGL